MENEKLSKALSDIWDSLTDEQKEKAKECKTADELIALAGKEGIELPDEALESVAGGYVGYRNGSWEVIKDETWETIEKGYATMEEAQARAAELGVKTSYLIFVEPQKLEPDPEPEPEPEKKKCP